MRGLAAEFEQTYLAPGGGQRRESGRLFLARPRRMRWEYDPVPGKLFVVNGRELWFYSPADREATHADVGAVSDSRLPFLFLLGQTRLRSEFKSIELLPGPGSDPNMHRLRLKPRRVVMGLREIIIDVDHNGMISSIKMLEEGGAVSEFLLQNVRENYVAPANAFEFRPPVGVLIRRQH
jgi:outer membrane lipoprotein carrier protein